MLLLSVLPEQQQKHFFVKIYVNKKSKRETFVGMSSVMKNKVPPLFLFLSSLMDSLKPSIINCSFRQLLSNFVSEIIISTFCQKIKFVWISPLFQCN